MKRLTSAAMKTATTIAVIWFLFGWFCPRLYRESNQVLRSQTEGRLLVVKSYCDKGVFYALENSFDRIPEMYKIDPWCAPSCSNDAVEVYLQHGERCMWLELSTGSEYFPYRNQVLKDLRDKLASTPLRF